MGTNAIIPVIIILYFLVIFLFVPDYKQKTSKPRKEEIETELKKLYHDYVGLNNDALNAYNALIQAASNPSQTSR